MPSRWLHFCVTTRAPVCWFLHALGCHFGNYERNSRGKAFLVYLSCASCRMCCALLVKAPLVTARMAYLTNCASCSCACCELSALCTLFQRCTLTPTVQSAAPVGNQKCLPSPKPSSPAGCSQGHFCISCLYCGCWVQSFTACVC